MTTKILKCEKETVFKVDSYDLEAFIKEATGHEYETVYNEEWSNDSQHRFILDGKMNQWEKNDWETFKSTGKQELYHLRTILNGLCSEKQIEAGTYLITVCW